MVNGIHSHGISEILWPRSGYVAGAWRGNGERANPVWNGGRPVGNPAERGPDEPVPLVETYWAQVAPART